MKKEKSRFLDLFSSFSDKERKEFNEFVSIDLFGNNRTYKDFFDNIKTDDSGKLVIKSKIKDRTLSNRLTELTKLAQRYLVMKNMESNKFKFEITLLEELNNRNINNYYDQRIISLQKDLLKRKVNIGKVMDMNDFLHLKRGIDADKLNCEDPYGIYHDTIDISSILFVIEYLQYKIWDIIQHHNNRPGVAKFSSFLTEMIDFEKVLSYIKSNHPEFHPLVSFYYYLYKAFLNPDDTYNYYTARKLFINNLKSDSKYENNYFFNFLIDFNAYKQNLGKGSAGKELFSLINMKIESGLFAEEITIETSSLFMVSVMIALPLNKFEWTEKFIEKYGPYLPENTRDNSIFLSKAFLEFHKNNFTSCEKYSEMVYRSDPFFYVNATKLKLQSCYELNKSEECYVVLKRFNEYLRKHKDSEDIHIRFAKEYCSGFSLLIKFKENPTEKNHVKISMEIKNKKLITEDWFTDKISELELEN